jgi:hypothetical protein
MDTAFVRLDAIGSCGPPPVTGELLLGTVNGDLVTVDAASGAVTSVTSTTPATTGPLVAFGYSRFGTDWSAPPWPSRHRGRSLE